MSWHRIGCAVDFSERSREAMHLAVDLAARLGAELELVNVVPPPRVVVEVPLPVAQQLREYVEQATRNLAAWQREAMARAPIKVETTVKVGPPVEEILHFAQEKRLDALVLGTHGRGFVGRLVLGSVAERVLRKAHCPVITVGPRAHVENEQVAS